MIKPSRQQDAVDIVEPHEDIVSSAIDPFEFPWAEVQHFYKTQQQPEDQNIDQEKQKRVDDALLLTFAESSSSNI
jgi:hypothetical protein